MLKAEGVIIFPLKNQDHKFGRCVKVAGLGFRHDPVQWIQGRRSGYPRTPLLAPDAGLRAAYHHRKDQRLGES